MYLFISLQFKRTRETTIEKSKCRINRIYYSILNASFEWDSTSFIFCFVCASLLFQLLWSCIFLRRCRFSPYSLCVSVVCSFSSVVRHYDTPRQSTSGFSFKQTFLCAPQTQIRTEYRVITAETHCKGPLASPPGHTLKYIHEHTACASPIQFSVCATRLVRKDT